MEIIKIVLGALLLVFVICLLLTWPFMVVWNYAVVAAISVAKPIGYWVAFCLILILITFISAFSSKIE